MKPKHYLVVGASSVAGNMAIAAIRLHDPNARITTTTSKPVPVSGADSNTIYGIDFSQTATLDALLPDIVQPVNVLVFCPAFGTVGYPAEFAPLADVEDCFEFSVRPLLRLIDELNPQLTLAFSSFYWLHSLEIAYGSMAFAKYALEKLAVENPHHIRVVRSGLFPSKSLRGICLLIQRAVQNESFPGAAKLKADWKASGLAFAVYFTEFAQCHEKRDLSRYFTAPYRATEGKDLIRAVGIALQANAQAIVNVVGDSL